MNDLIAPIVEEITRALGIDEKIIERELTQLIVEYKVPPEEAKRSVLKRHRRAPPTARDADGSTLQSPPSSAAPAESEYKFLKDARVGDMRITIAANIISPEYREISTPGGSTGVITGMLEDSTARVHFTAWVDVPDMFRVKGIIARDVNVKSFHGMPSINISDKTILEEYPGDITPYVRQRSSIFALTQTDGVYDAETEGDLLSIRPGSGLIERCPTCSRVMQKGQCRAHGRLRGNPDLRIKAVIDDGTGSIIVVFDRALTEKITGLKIEDLMIDQEKSAEIIKAAVIGTPVIVRGNVTRGDYGMIMVATEVERPPDDAGKQAKQLLGGLG